MPPRRGSSNLPWRLNPLQAGRCPAGPHKPGVPGSIPGPGTAGGPVLGRVSYARRRRFDSPTRNSRCSWHGTLTGIAATTTFGRCPEPGACGFESHPCYCPHFVPSSSGQDACLTHRIAQVRVLPGRLSADRSAGVPAAHLLGREGDRVRFSGGPSCKRVSGSSREQTPALDPGDRDSIAVPVHALNRAAGPTGRRRHRTPEIGVRLPGGPLYAGRDSEGPIVQRNDTGSAGRRPGFDSRWVHSNGR